MGNGNYVLVGDVSEFKNHRNKFGHAMKCVSVENRSIIVVYKENRFFALDSICYHYGGPLVEGDIEDYGGHLSVICPWHRYPISLENGEGFYQGLDKSIKSKGIKQRTHLVKVENDKLYVKISKDGTVSSDEHYQKHPSIRPTDKVTVYGSDGKPVSQ